MSRRTVTVKVTDPSGAPIEGAVVRVRAAHPEGRLVTWPGGDESLVAETTRTTDATGLVSIDLVPNAELQPPGSYYVVEIEGKTRRVRVPAGTDPIDLADLVDV
jgi:hypothetical protein